MIDIQLTMFPILRSWLATLAFDARTRERCWKKLGRQLRVTHLPLEYCFRVLQERAQREHNPVHHVYGQIVRSLNSGERIGKALSRYAGPEEVMLIDSGQTGGEFMLAEGFAKAAELMEKKRRIKGMIIKQLAYPTLLLCLVIGFLFMIATVLIPELMRVSSPEKWSGTAWLLYKISSFVNSWYGGASLVLLVTLFFLIGWSFKRWCGPGRTVADRLPPWSIYRILVGVSWLYATAILLQTKEIKLVIILKKLIENKDTSPYLRSRLRPIYRLTMQGFSLGEALCKTATRWPDRILADDLRTYAALPGFNQQLGSIAEEMLEDSVEKIQAGASVMGVVSILLLSLTIILMVLGLLSINQHVTQGLGL